MSYQGSLWQPGTYKVSSSVAAGDLLVVVIGMENYLLRGGDVAFRPSDLLLPQGWTLVDLWTDIKGGDPRRVTLSRAVAARIADSGSAGSVFTPGSAVPYYEADQDEGSSRVSTGNSRVELHGGGNLAAYWRGETGLAAVQRWLPAAPAHTAALPAGDSRDGAASVARWANWTWATGTAWPLMWKSADNGSNDVINPPRSGQNPLVTGQGAAGSVYAYQSSSSTYYSATGTCRTYALSATVQNYPMRPTLTYPADGARLDLANAGVTASWVHNASLAGPQAGWSLSVKVAAGAVKWWDEASQSWSVSQVVNSGTSRQAAIPAAAFAGGTGYAHAFEVYTRSGTGQSSAPSATATVTAVLAPAVTVGLVGAVSGSVATLIPQVRVAGTATGSLAVTNWEASLVDVATLTEVASGAGVFDQSGIVTWSPGVQVVNGTVVRATARVQQVGGAWSEVGSDEAVASVTVPGVPAVSAAPGEHPVSGAPNLLVQAVFPWETDGYPWTAQPTTLEIERLDGQLWVLCAVLPLPAGVTTGTVEDYGAGAGPARYRARGVGAAVDGSRLEGGYGYTDTVVVSPDAGWLLDPAAPEGALRVSVVDESARDFDLSTVRMTAAGRESELVASGTPLLQTGSDTVRVDAAQDVHRVVGLLQSGALLKLGGCRERTSDGASQYAETLWFRPVGSVKVARVFRGPRSARDIEFSWVEQAPPVIVVGA